MPNKNDLSDLAKFSLSLLATIFAIVFLAAQGLARANQQFGDEIRAAQAKISQHLWQKSEAAGR